MNISVLYGTTAYLASMTLLLEKRVFGKVQVGIVVFDDCQSTIGMAV